MSLIVECHLCPHHCRIAEGGRGNCRVRTNVGGKLFSLVYGKPCAVHVDPIEKKPFYHVRPASRSFSIATAGCNLHCQYCQNWEISQRPPEETHNIDLPPDQAVAQARYYNCQSIAYTYSEPIIFYEYTYDTSRLAKDAGLLNLLVTAGYIEQEPLKELCQVTHAANVDLKGITEEYYKNMSQASLKPVQDCILTMKKLGVWVELTNLIVPTWNDDEKDIRALVRWVKEYCGREMPIHFSRFWPMHKLANLPPTPVSVLTRAWEIAKEEGLAFPYIGNVPDHPGNNTYCPHDGKLLISRVGYQVTENHVTDGKCPHCGTTIAGIW